MFDNVDQFEFSSGFFPPKKYINSVLDKIETLNLGEKWETLLIKDLFGQIRLEECGTNTSSDLAKQITDS